jgi:Na+/glutamate symporter
MLLVLIASAALGLVTWLVLGSAFAGHRVTKAQIEHTVAQRTPGHVQVTLCNEEVVPSQTPQSKTAHTWTCDTYVGPTAADAQNGPSYRVIVDHDRIQSIRRVPTH